VVVLLKAVQRIKAPPATTPRAATATCQTPARGATTPFLPVEEVLEAGAVPEAELTWPPVLDMDMPAIELPDMDMPDMVAIAETDARAVD
jgi:hypothetical protein